MTGVELLVSELKSRGVRWISTLCGYGLNPLYMACHKAGIRLVDTRNEQTAGYMAECWGRLTRQVGVCAVSSGVAHANAMTGVLNAHFDGTPMLLITGAGALTTAGMGHFQDLDQVALAAPVCKYARVISTPERIPQWVNEAFAAALTDRPGPVHFTLPLDVQDAVVDEHRVRRHTASLLCDTVTANAGRDLSNQCVKEVAALFAASRRPLIVAGSGVYYSGAERAMAEFAASLSLPIVAPIWDRGSVLDPIPQFMGVIGAASGGPRLLPDADLILLLGAASDYRVGYLQPPHISSDAHIIRVDVDAKQLHLGPTADLAIHVSPRAFLEVCNSEFAQGGVPPFREWLQEARRRRDTFRANLLPGELGQGMHAIHIIDALREVVTDDTVCIMDGGSIGQWFHQLFCDRYPGRYLTCGASAVIGFGIAGAMAARIVCPDSPVILLSGDGSMTFTIADLECAARQGLPFVAIVADDERWGIADTGFVKQYGESIATTLGPVEFDVVARGFGCYGVRVVRPDEIMPAIREGLAADKPTVIHVPIVGGMPGD